MGYSKDQCLARLQELDIVFAKFEHPAVLTVEAQAKYVGDKGGALSKNLFLKDKKHRLYVVSALANTKVDLKVLSQRLGLGKGGLRMAPEEAVVNILQVPLGCVTPFALMNELARNVSLLLDQGFKSQEFCFFYPLSNEVSISLKANDLDKFLEAIGRDPSYVDLEANPSVGKDQPPDLAALVPSDAIVFPGAPEKAPSSQSPGINVALGSKSTALPAKTVKSSNSVQNDKDKKANSGNAPGSFTDAGQFMDEILDKTTSLILAEIKPETIKQHGEHLGTILSHSIKKQLSSEFKNLAIIFKNTVYTEGFHAGKQHQSGRH